MKKKYRKHLILKLGAVLATCFLDQKAVNAFSTSPQEGILWSIDGEIPQNLQTGRFSGKERNATLTDNEPYSPPSTPVIALKSLERESAPPNAPRPPLRQQTLPPNEIAQAEQTTTKNILPEDLAVPEFPKPTPTDQQKTILINFNNVSIVEFIRFISRVSNKNFVFDENDLQFNVTIISEEPTTIENILTALIQELRIHDLMLIEQGNNLIIHKNKSVQAISRVMAEDTLNPYTAENEVVTQVFRLNSTDAEKVASIIRPLISKDAILDVLKETNHIVVTDLTSNVAEIGKLIKNLDAPKSGMVIGQYVVRTSSIEALINMAEQIMQPIANDQTLIFVPHHIANSIFIVSSPYLVERTISILQHMDQNQKANKIYDYRDFKYQLPTFETKEEIKLPPAGVFLNGSAYSPAQEKGLELQEPFPGEGATFRPGFSPQFNPPPISVPLLGTQNVNAPQGTETLPQPPKQQTTPWNLDPQGNWFLKVEFAPEIPFDQNTPPQGRWDVDASGNWEFIPGSTTGVLPTQGVSVPAEAAPKPKGDWKLDELGTWTFLLDPTESITVNKLVRPEPRNAPIPYKEKKKNQFYIHKLQYRKGFEIESSLQKMAEALITNGGRSNEPLAAALSSVQWLETSNSLIFSGDSHSLEKIEFLVEIIDQPLRQVFIEMLIMETTVQDSLDYSVTWSDRSQGEWSAGQVAFNPDSTIDDVQDKDNGTMFPSPGSFKQTGTFSLGVIGSKIINTALGLEFNSIAALVKAIQTRQTSNLILNPKIMTEDSVPAEIFVGVNTSFQTQAISNVNGNAVTKNFEFRDVGTRLRVTPFLGNSDIITLEISQERSQVITLSDVNSTGAGPSTSINKTTTRVHVPSGFFVILSGILEDGLEDKRSQVPCLGGIPVLGAAFKSTQNKNHKQNLMIFIRPEIMDTEEQLNRITADQQKIFTFKRRLKKEYMDAVEGALEFMNLKKREQDDEDPVFEQTDDFR